MSSRFSVGHVVGLYLHLASLLAAARCAYALVTATGWGELWLLGLVVAMVFVVATGLAGLEGWIDGSRESAVFRWQLVGAGILGASVGAGACLLSAWASLSVVPGGLRAGVIAVSIGALVQTAVVLAAFIATFGLYAFLAARVAWRAVRSGDEVTFDEVFDDEPPLPRTRTRLGVPGSAGARKAVSDPKADPARLLGMQWPGQHSDLAIAMEVGWPAIERALLSGGERQAFQTAGALAATLHLAPALNEAEATRARAHIVRLCASESTYRLDPRSASGDPEAAAERIPVSIAELATQALNAWEDARRRQAPRT